MKVTTQGRKRCSNTNTDDKKQRADQLCKWVLGGLSKVTEIGKIIHQTYWKILMQN